MEANIVMTHITSAAVVVYVMNRLKQASWFPLIQKDANWLNRAFSVGMALLVSIGIHYTWTAEPDGSHELLLMIPSATALLQGIWHVLQQYVSQEVLFQATKAKA